MLTDGEEKKTDGTVAPVRTYVEEVQRNERNRAIKGRKKSVFTLVRVDLVASRYDASHDLSYETLANRRLTASVRGASSSFAL